MRILIAYATLSGNTQSVAENLEQYLKQQGKDVSLVNLEGADLNQMKTYDLVFIGSSTWGEGEPNPTADEFLHQLEEYADTLGNTKFAIFGLGDSSYPSFCGVITKFKELLKEKGKEEIIESFKIDGYPDDTVYNNIHAWADKAIIASG